MINGLQPSLAEGGKIKIGGKGKEIKSRKGNKFRPPEKYDHFIITTTTRDRAGDLIVDTELMQALLDDDWGDDDGKLRKIPITVHEDTFDKIMPTFYAAYAGKKLACRGDGQVATRYRFNDRRERLDETFEIECPCESLADGRCKPHGNLHCSIMAPGCAVAGAVHRYRTTSMISIEQLYGSVTQILATVGVLQGLPLVLRVMPINVSPQGRPTTVYCCHMELRAKDLQSVQKQALQLAQLRTTLQMGGAREQYAAMLQPPGMESDEEAADIQAEFYCDEEPAEQTSVGRRAAAFRDDPTPDDPIDTTAEVVDANQAAPDPEPEPPNDDGEPSYYDQAVAIALEVGKTADDVDAAAKKLGIDIMPGLWGESELNAVANELTE